MDTDYLVGESRIPNPDAVRAYLRELRIGQRFSYTKFAKMIGYNRRSLVGWEMGETGELKQSVFIRAANALGASLVHLGQLTDPDADADLGRALARARLSEIAATMTDEELKRNLRAIRHRRGAAADDLDGD